MKRDMYLLRDALVFRCVTQTVPLICRWGKTTYT